MGIAHRAEMLQNAAKTKSHKNHIYSCYERLCSPEQMGAIYKVLFIGEKSAGDVYPFLTEESIKKHTEYFE